MPSDQRSRTARGRQARQPGETDEHYAFRVSRRAELVRQVSEEVRFAAAGRRLPLAEVARRMGDPNGRVLARADGPLSLAKLADIGTAMGVTFRLVAIPDDDMVPNGGEPYQARRRIDRAFTPEQVRDIRRRVKAGDKQVLLAKEFGVSPSVISDVMRGITYTDVD
jgi:hypothetical protein